MSRRAERMVAIFANTWPQCFMASGLLARSAGSFQALRRLPSTLAIHNWFFLLVFWIIVSKMSTWGRN